MNRSMLISDTGIVLWAFHISCLGSRRSDIYSSFPSRFFHDCPWSCVCLCGLKAACSSLDHLLPESLVCSDGLKCTAYTQPDLGRSLCTSAYTSAPCLLSGNTSLIYPSDDFICKNSL